MENRLPRERLLRKPLAILLMSLVMVSHACAWVLAAPKPDRLKMKSTTLGLEISVIVQMPADRQEGINYPSIYVLPNAGSPPSDWLEKTELSELAAKYGCIAVVPDGGRNWYLDSDKTSGAMYETFITKELIPYIDANYPTITNASSRGLTGVGMGGNGAFTLAMKHPDLFTAAASINGQLDLKTQTGNKDLSKRLGPYDQNKAAWSSNSALGRALSAQVPAGLSLFISAGTNDPTLKSSRDMHNVLLAAGVNHSYIEHPGASAWQFVSSHLEESIALLASKICQPDFSNPLVPDLVTIDSKALGKSAKLYVLKPEGYNLASKYPVLYLLHGAYGGYEDWYKNSKLASRMRGFKMLIVLPDGGQFGWYVDSPVEAKSQYETFITKELVPYVDATYPTVTSPQGRALAGLSMGGHGAVTLAIKHPELFGAASSLSGIVDISRHPTDWELDKRLGAKKKNPTPWLANSAFIATLDKHYPIGLQLFVSCGIDDFAFPENRDFHQALSLLGIPHSYVEHPGIHDWMYWDAHITEHLIFHQAIFDKASGN